MGENKVIHTISDITIGMRETYSKTILDIDIKDFSDLSGDRNPVHLDESYAKTSRFKKRIAHGLLSASFFSAIFGTKLPGRGCVYMAQTLEFKRPVYINDTVIATVVVTEINKDKNIIFFDTYCEVKGKKVITGTAEIFIP